MVRKPSTDVRATILEAALACFTESGFNGTTMAAIARRAGMTAAAIYRYFPGKRELFEALERPDLDFPDPRGEERRRAVLAGALTVFSQKGYAATTMDDVAEVVGLSKAALYGYFASKEELFAAVLAHPPMADLVGLMAATGPNGPPADPEEFLSRLALGYLRMFRDPGRLGLLRIILAEGGRHPGVSAAFLTAVVDRGSELVASFLNQAGLGPATRLQPLVQAFFGMLFSWVVMHRVLSQAPPGQGPDPEEAAMAGRAVQLFLHGVQGD